jgi:cell wall-associated NlpC family hydrolase
MRKFIFFFCLAFSLMVCFANSAPVLAAPSLKLSTHGHDVEILQQQLQRLNYSISKIDGIFGEETKRAVLEFQRDQHMKITGQVDGSTWRAIKRATPRKGKPAIDDDTLPLLKGQLNVPESRPFLSRSKVNAILMTAKKYIGVPYSFGGTTPRAFDCSGYLQYVFAQNGISFPRTADEQYKLGLKASQNQLEAGDLVFFTTYEPGASHCGIYLGNGKFIHASSSKGVRIDELSNSYWQPRYYGGKHIIQ